ncbi:M12 family metallopeptidase [Parapedobacter tibetensis]|uniref:M12 family metallopeptidase n=1 Tax=Parapedobacter tibetensis TaxID=2972951 RepID=UPI00214DB0C2|nr:M12 family metallopeptidase [Parapedobacter tibetensis]
MKKSKWANVAIKSCLVAALVVAAFACSKENVGEQQTESVQSEGVVFHMFVIDGNKTIVREVNGEFYISDDEMLSKRQFNILKRLANDGITTTERGAIIADFVKKWTDGIWYYKIESSRGADIQEAMSWISDNSNVRFIERTNQSQYVTIYDAASNDTVAYSNHVGMETGISNKEIVIHSDFGIGSIAHEILHSLGFFHEQSRPDRDNFIRVYENRLPNDAGIRYQYQINPLSQGVGAFDFNSIMLYSSYYNGTVIMENLVDNSTWFNQRSHLSQGDKEGLARLYGPRIAGPAHICNDGTYTISAGTVSLDNATGIATLTALGNNQYQISRIGNASGVVTLKSTVGGNTTSRSIYVGYNTIQLGIDNMVDLQGDGTGSANRFTVLEGSGVYRYFGVLTIFNTTEAPTTYTWSKVSGSTGIPTVYWNSLGPRVTVYSKGKGGWVRLKCTATTACASFERDYYFYVGIPTP